VDPSAVTPGVAGWAHLVVFGLLVPWAALRSRRWLRLADPDASRARSYRLLLVQLWVFAFLSLAVAVARGIELPLARWPSWSHALLGLGSLAAVVALMWPLWARSARERDAVFRFFVPGDGRQRLLWVLVSASAGISEEITWRGVQYALLLALLGGPAPAVAVCSVMFGLAHLGQGWRGALLAAPFAAMLHVIVTVSGSLALAMALHFLYDVIAGLTLSWMDRRPS